MRSGGWGGRGEEAGEGEAGVGGGEEGGEDGGGVGVAEGEEALVAEEAGEAGEGGFEGGEGGRIEGLVGGGEAALDKGEDDEADEGDLLIEAGDGGGAGVVVELLGAEFAGVEAVLEGVGVAGLGAGAARGGHGGDSLLDE